MDSVEDHPMCAEDSLTVYDAGSMAGIYCGGPRQIIWTSSSAMVRLHFASNDDVTGAGFAVEYDIVASLEPLQLSDSSQCPNLEFTAPTGMISSPLYPQNYPNNVKCSWTIQGGVNEVKHIAQRLSKKRQYCLWETTMQ